MVVWEALAHGTVVVSTRYIGSGQERALRHRENCLLFDIGEVKEAVDAIHGVAGDKACAIWLGA